MKTDSSGNIIIFMHLTAIFALHHFPFYVRENSNVHLFVSLPSISCVSVVFEFLREFTSKCFNVFLAVRVNTLRC